MYLTTYVYMFLKDVPQIAGAVLRNIPVILVVVIVATPLNLFHRHVKVKSLLL